MKKLVLTSYGIFISVLLIIPLIYSGCYEAKSNINENPLVIPSSGFSANIDISGRLGNVIQAGPLVFWESRNGNVKVNFLFGNDFNYDSGKGFFFLFLGKIDNNEKVSIKGIALYGYAEPLF